MAENGRQIAVAVTIALVGALALGAFANLSFPSQTASVTLPSTQSVSTGSTTTTTQVSSIMTAPNTTSNTANGTVPATTASTTTTVASSVTAPCSSPGVQCGSFQITSATLVASPGADTASNLTIGLANTGNVRIGAFLVFLDYSVNGSEFFGGLDAGQQTTTSFSVQNDQFLVAAGETYTILVEGFLISDNHITANLWGSVQVLASSKSGTATSTTSIGSTLSCTGNCTISLPWPVYQTMGDLKDASPFVVVANVTSVSVTSVDGIPLTVYQLSVITNIEGPGVNKSAGMTTLPMAQIGGTANGTTVSIEGYPTLSVGSTYVLFLNGSGSLYPAYYDGYLTSVGGPQGTFLVQRGGVYSLDTLYPKTDVWLPIKANDVPLSQFMAEVQGS